MPNYELQCGRPSKFFFYLPIWKKIAEAKNSKIIKTCELKDSQYMFAAHPHGVIPLGICLHIGTNGGDVHKIFPHIRFRGVAVSCCYIIPFYRDFCLALGGTDCRSSTIRNVIHHGCSSVVVPGGAEESLLSRNHQNTILVKHRGFIRIAIQEGLAIVPMYSFGENNLWTIPKESKPIPWINALTKKLLGFCIPPMKSILPHNTQLTLVFGSPIPVEKKDNPSEEEIDHIHELYVQQTQELFTKYKPEDEEDLVIRSFPVCCNSYFCNCLLMSTFSYNGVRVKFPFPPYDIQKDYMRKVIDAIKNKENAMLESPTGTGKTLSLLCAALATMSFKLEDYIPTQYLEYLAMQEKLKKRMSFFQSQNVDMFKSSFKITESQVAGKKLIYCSRTHSQLKQVVREIKKTVYTPRVMVMGSREQLCSNEDVRSRPVFAQKQVCQHLGGQCKPRINLSGKHAHDIYNSDLPRKGLMDIEDLYKFGRKKNICPYYLSRCNIAMIESQVLLMPYNYIMDPMIRKTLPFDSTDCVLIIDEAHNIDSFCLDSMSYDLSAKILYEMQREIKELIKRGTAKVEGMFSSLDTQQQEETTNIVESELYLALSLIQKIEDTIKEYLQRSKIVQYFGNHAYEFFKKCGIDGSSFMQVINLLETIIQIRYDHFPNAKACYIEILLNFLKLLFNEGAYLSESESSKWMFVVYYHEDSIWDKEAKKHNKVEFPCIGFWCMDCSVAMKQVMKTGISTIIFTSGTLSPMNPLIYEFQIPIAHLLENYHVIQDSQCMVATIDKSAHGIPLSTSYSARQNPVVKNETMDSILTILPTIPGNVLIFFPSYGYLNDCYYSWEHDGRIRLLRGIKDVYKEEAGMSNEQFNSIVSKFDSAQHSRGAVLLAVCRGKASEGIDFSDDRCRCVIMIGIPYPPFTDIKVKMRRDYLDEKNKQQMLFNDRSRLAAQRRDTHIPTMYPDLPLASAFNIQAESFSGSDWYTISAHRAVNQSVGRAIRHRDDFGIILLMDERFTAPASQERLSKWLQPFIQPCKSFESLEKDIQYFFTRNKSGFKPTKVLTRPADALSFEQRLEANPTAGKVSKTPGTSGLFSKMRLAKSQSVASQSTQVQTPKKTTAASIDSDDEFPQRDNAKREAFINNLKTTEAKPPEKITPPPKGIKRFFHSEEAKRPKLNEDGAYSFESPEKPIRKNLFGRYLVSFTNTNRKLFYIH